MRVKTCLLLLLAGATLRGQASYSPIGEDPAPDLAHPASFTEMAVPSHGQSLLGLYYGATGAGNHPTIVLLHGFPGYEQNLDLAQVLRRAGWNVLALHYRGSWGVGGDFSITHAMEDADAMVAFVRSQDAVSKYHIDRNRIVVVGHSMGGFLTASATAHEPAVLGSVIIGAWDITAPARGVAGLSRQELVARIEKKNETEPADFLPLHGFDPHTLAGEIADHREDWDLIHFAPGIASRPILLLTADDGSDPGSARLEQALKTAGNAHVQRIHTATDHSFSGRRIYLATMILKWLAALPDQPVR